MASGFFISAFSLGTFVGPIGGGSLSASVEESSYAKNFCLDNFSDYKGDTFEEKMAAC